MNQQRLNDVLQASDPALKSVHPLLASKVRMLIAGLAAKELYFGAFMGLRTVAQQDDLYAQGRTKPGKIVTKAKGGQSWHNFGLAVDMVEDGDAKPGVQWSWNNSKNFLLIGDVAKSLGLSWGGYWKSMKDYPHVELTADLTLTTATNMYKQTNTLVQVWQHVEDWYRRNGSVT